MNRTLPRRSSTSSGVTLASFVSAPMFSAPSVAARPRTSERRRRREEVPGVCTSALAEEEARAVGIFLDGREQRVTGQTAPCRYAKPRARIVDAHFENLSALECLQLLLHPRFERPARLTVAIEDRNSDGL